VVLHSLLKIVSRWSFYFFGFIVVILKWDEGVGAATCNPSDQCLWYKQISKLYFYFFFPPIILYIGFFLGKFNLKFVYVFSRGTEEAALMELLNFMYSNTLSVTTAPALLDVLMAADKFEVASCMRYCSRLLRNMPMTPESALLYLELPSSVLMGEAVQPLTDTAKQYLAARYKDMTK